MAATTIKPYPHIQINVKDNSIATIDFVEVLPVHRPLYVMRTQKGPLGEPVWCNTYSEAAALFGAETFNPANKTYFSRSALYLRETLTRNGAFISRYLPEGHQRASVALLAAVKVEGIDQYRKNEDGTRQSRYNSTTHQFEDDPTGDEETGVKIQFVTKSVTFNNDGTVDYNSTFSSSGTKPTYVSADGILYVPLAVFVAKDHGAYGNDLAFRLFYSAKSNEPGDVDSYKTLFYNIGFAEREPGSTTWDAITDIYNRENCAFAANKDAVNPDTGAPLSIDYVLDKGFSDNTHILPVEYDLFEENFNILGLIIAAYENDGKPLSFNDDDSYKYDKCSLNSIDGDIGHLTSDERSEMLDYVTTGGTCPIDSTLGYKVNVISGVNLSGVPYDHVLIVKDQETATLKDGSVILTNKDTDGVVTSRSGDEVSAPAEGFSLVSLTDFFSIPLDDGSDGTFVDTTETERAAGSWSTDDEAMYRFCKLKLEGIKDRIVESLRFPMTHIFDVGFTMKTKKAMLDFLDVRDDVVMIMSPQVLYLDGSKRPVKQNDQATDEANTEALRAYALLMRESVLYGTDCMRASIYEHSGHLVNSVFDGIVPHTYWAAVQYAQYGNLPYMNQIEPRGLPYSYNLLFKDQNWTNYRADSQSRVWDEGGNYVQFADMTRLFYPSLRTVYRAATSVLIDEWVVAAVVYAKYVCRRAWARFSGRNDSATKLQSAIKQYLDAELTTLFNGKYSFDVTVYQTAEEQELGYIQHVKLSITFGATMRVLDVDIEVNRENFVAEE